MAALSELQSQRADLVEARSSGSLRTRHGDDEVTYRSVAEINVAIAAIDRDIAALSGRRIHSFYPTFTKGL